MAPLPDQAQENLTSLIEGGLELAHDFLEDAVVHLQLRHYVLAGEALRDASQTVDFVERYLPSVVESNKLVRYQADVSTARERVQGLDQSISLEGTKSPLVI